MERRVLLLLDGLTIRKEVMTYAVEFSRRIDAELHLLLLLHRGPGHPGKAVRRKDPRVDRARKRGEVAMEGCLQEIRVAGLEPQGAVRWGDPSSELFKYLASEQPFQAVVWGGNEKFLSRKWIPVRRHWLERIREELNCPLVIPSLKLSDNQGKRNRKTN